VSDPLAPAAAADDDVDVVVCAAPDAEESVAPADASAPAPLAAEAPAAPAPRIESDSSTDAEGGAPDAEPDLRALVTLLLARSDDNARRLGTAVYALSQRVDGLTAAVAAQARATASANHAPPPPRAPRSAVPAAASKGGGGSSKLSRGNLVIVLADSRAVQSSFASSATVAWQGAKDMSLLGKLGCVRQIDRSDGTIEVRFVDDSRRWFPPAALQGPLSLGDGMNVRELGPEPLGKGAIAAASAATASAAAAAAATSTRDTLASSQFPSAAPGMPSAGPGARTRPAATQAPSQAHAKVRAKARAIPQAAPAAAKQAGGEQRQRVPSAGGKTGRRRGSAAGSDSDEDAAQSVLTRQKATETDSWLQQQALLVAGPGQGPAQSRAERQRAQRAEVDRARIRTAEERAKREEIMARRAKEKMLRKVAFDRKEEEMRSRLREDQAKLRNRVSGATSMEHSTLAAERDRKRAAASKSRAIFQGLFGGDEGAEGEGSGADDGAEGGDAAKEEGGGDREEGAAGTGEGAATTKKTKAKKKKVSLFEGISEPASSLANASSSSSGGGGAGESYFMYRYISRESCSQFDSRPLTSLTRFPGGGGGLFCDAPLEIPSAGEVREGATGVRAKAPPRRFCCGASCAAADTAQRPFVRSRLHGTRDRTLLTLHTPPPPPLSLSLSLSSPLPGPEGAHASARTGEHARSAGRSPRGRQGEAEG
jgi:ribonuclease E